jgi:hypothetical protein
MLQHVQGLRGRSGALNRKCRTGNPLVTTCAVLVDVDIVW